MMTKEVCTKIVNFMTPGPGVFVLGCGHISYIVKGSTSSLLPGKGTDKTSV